MICRRCGNRIPEYLTTREFFQCPSCGRSFGTPPEERRSHDYQPRASRGEERRTRYEREEASYNNRRAASRFEAEYPDDDYYEDQYGVYEEPEQDFYEESEDYEDLKDVEAMPATMKLTTLIGFEALALIALAVAYFVSLGM